MKEQKNLIKDCDTKSTIIKEALGFMGDVFGELQQDAKLSQFLLESNIEDSLAKFLNNTLENPIDSIFDLLHILERKFVEIINIYILKFFKENSDIIKEVYRAKNTGNFLHYSIILKNNNKNNRKKIRKFVNNYNDKPHSSRFPIVFQDIPKELIDEFKKGIKEEDFELLEYERTS